MTDRVDAPECFTIEAAPGLSLQGYRWRWQAVGPARASVIVLHGPGKHARRWRCA